MQPTPAHYQHQPASHYPYVPVLSDDVEKGLNNEGYHAFAERAVRQGFIRKVFGILSLQLLTTFAISSVFVFSSAVKTYVLTHPWMLMVSMLAGLGFLLTFTFSETARKQHPTNLLLLAGFTIAESILVGAASAQYQTEIVVLALALTAAITTTLCIYALRTKNDFTSMGGMLWCMLVVLIIAGFIGMFTKSSGFNILLSCGGAVLFSAYIVYDVQMLVGGQHKFSLSPEEYVFGAIAVYLDIINLFLHLLRLLNEMSNR